MTWKHSKFKLKPVVNSGQVERKALTEEKQAKKSVGNVKKICFSIIQSTVFQFFWDGFKKSICWRNSSSHNTHLYLILRWSLDIHSPLWRRPFSLSNQVVHLQGFFALFCFYFLFVRSLPLQNGIVKIQIFTGNERDSIAWESREEGHLSSTLSSTLHSKRELDTDECFNQYTLERGDKCCHILFVVLWMAPWTSFSHRIFSFSFFFFLLPLFISFIYLFVCLFLGFSVWKLKETFHFQLNENLQSIEGFINFVKLIKLIKLILWHLFYSKI